MRLPIAALLLASMTAAGALAARQLQPEVAPRCADRSALTDLLNQSEAAYAAGAQGNGLALLQQALGNASSPGCEGVHGEILRRLAMADSSRSDFAAALDKLDQALSLLRQGEMPREEARALLQQGYALYRSGRPGDAIEPLRAARERFLSWNDTERVLSADAYLVASLRGPEAEAAIASALAYARSVPGGRRHECGLLQASGDRLFNAGRYADAVSPLTQAIACFEETGNWLALGTAYVSLGRVYRAHGRLDLALEQHERGLAVQRRVPTQEATIQTINAIAVTLGRMGRNAEAIVRLEEALAQARALGSARYVDFLQGSLAGVYLETGRYREAATLLESVLRSPTPAQAAVRTAQLANAYAGLGDLDRALEVANRAVALVRDDDTDALFTALEDRVYILTALHRFDDASSDLARLLERIERLRTDALPGDFLRRGFGERHQGIFSAAVALQQGQGRVQEALETAEQARGRAFLDLLAARSTSSASASAGRAAGLGRAATLAEMTETSRRLDSTILAFWVDTLKTTVWIVKPDGGLSSVVIPVTAARLTALVHDAVGGAGSGGLVLSPAAAARPWRALAKTLIDPLERLLPVRRGSRLTIIPHGPLFGLSFAALPDAAGRYLLERYDLHYVPAAGVLAYTPRVGQSPQGSALLVGDPGSSAGGDADSRLPPIPWAAREVRNIRRLLPTAPTVLVDAEATEARVRAELAGRSLLHFATHAIVRNEERLTSYLALARGPRAPAGALSPEQQDGRLTAEELYGLQLDADLVVLSGCGTALGPVSGEGVIGFTRAFLAAGASSVVATLWDVPDRTSFEVMRAFYPRWLAGSGKSGSLRNAQLELLRALRAGTIVVDGHVLPETPRLWAAYALVGEP